MSESSQLQLVSDVFIVVQGSGYESCMDNDLRRSFAASGINVKVTGNKTPACGPDIWIDLAFNVGVNLAASVIKELLCKIFNCVTKAINQRQENNCQLNSAKVNINGCEYTISATSAAGYDFKSINYKQLLSDMKDFCDYENSLGRNVSLIETPCEIDCCLDEDQVRCNGVGLYCLWRVTYFDGEDATQCLYDATNELLLPLDATEKMLDGLSEADDVYYSGREFL